MELTKGRKCSYNKKKLTSNQSNTHNLTDNNGIQPIFMLKESVGETDFYKCQQCPYMTLSMKEMEFHWQSIHTTSEIHKKKVNAKNITLKCPGCLGLFHSEAVLKTHLRSHHKMGAKDIQRLTSSLTREVKKNHDYLENLEVVIEGHENSNINILDTKNMPPLIEIVSETPQHLPNQLSAVMSPNNNIENNNFTLTFSDNFSNVGNGPIAPQQPQQQFYLNVNPMVKILNDTNKTEILENSDDKNNTNNLDSKIEIIPEYAEIVDLSSIFVQNNTPLQNGLNSRQELIIHNNADTSIINKSKNKSKNRKHKDVNKKPKSKGRPCGSKSLGITNFKKHGTDEECLTKEFGHKCNVCGVRLFSLEKIAYHKSCHLENTKELFCPECQHFFLSIETLHTHLWKAHQIDLELHSCDQCSYKVYSLSRLNNIHKKIHSEEKKYTCETCSKAFKNSKQLLNHKVIHKAKTNQLKKYSCSICNRELSSRRQLSKHLNSVHQKIKPFQCEHCDYSAAEKHSLLLHMRLHTGEKPFQCNQCKFKTSDRSSLSRHMMRHSQQKRYKCKHCSYSCIQASSIKMHIKSKHPGVDTDLFHSCPYCSYKSVKEANYISHLSTHSTEIDNIKYVNGKSTAGTHKQVVDSFKKQSDNSFNFKIQDGGNSCEMIKILVEPSNVSSPITESDDFMLNLSSSNERKSADIENEVLIENLNNDAQIAPNYYFSHEDETFAISEYECVTVESSNDTIENIMSSNITRTITPIELSSQNNYQVFVKDIVDLADDTNDKIISQKEPLLQNSSHSIVQSANFGKTSTLPILLLNKTKNFSSNSVAIPENQSEKIRCKLFSTNPFGKLLTLPVHNNAISQNTSNNDGVPRKKPKISVKSNLILKGPDNVDTFYHQQRLISQSLQNEIDLNYVDLSTEIRRMETTATTVSPQTVVLNTPLSFISNNLPSNFLATSNYSFQNMHFGDLDANNLPEQSHFMISKPNIEIDNSQNLSETNHTSDVKIENKLFIPNSSEANLNDVFLSNDSMANEIVQNTLPIHVPIKFEDKIDILKPYMGQECLFNSSNALSEMENVSIIEELPASFETPIDPNGNDILNNFKNTIYSKSELLLAENYDKSEIIVIDDTSCDVKSLPIFSVENKFGFIHDQILRSDVNINRHALKCDSSSPFLRNDVVDKRPVKEKPRIISEVHITSDRRKIMNFAAVKNLGLNSTENSHIKTIDWNNMKSSNNPNDKPG